MQYVRLGRIESRYVDFRTECQLCEVDWHKHHQIVALALELLVLLNSD
jgi:hypothetical protein